MMRAYLMTSFVLCVTASHSKAVVILACLRCGMLLSVLGLCVSHWLTTILMSRIVDLSCDGLL